MFIDAGTLVIIALPDTMKSTSPWSWTGGPMKTFIVAVRLSGKNSCREPFYGESNVSLKKYVLQNFSRTSKMWIFYILRFGKGWKVFAMSGLSPLFIG